MKQNKQRIENNEKSKMKVIGITGGVGSGKSVVMNLLEKEFGAAIILADLVAHDLMEPGGISYNQIVEAFGTEILLGDGQIDRPALSKLVFSDESKLEQLNQITHPNVKNEIFSRIDNFRRQGKASFIAVEAALLIEGGYQDYLDEMWYIHVDDTLRIQRLMEGRGYSEEKSRSIMKSQLQEEEFRKHCSRVIDNNHGIEELREQLKSICPLAR